MIMSVFEWLSVLASVACFLLSITGFLFWYIIQSLIEGISEVKKELSQHKYDVVSTYMKSADAHSSFNALNNKMEDVRDETQKISLTIVKIAAKMNIDTDIK